MFKIVMVEDEEKVCENLENFLLVFQKRMTLNLPYTVFQTALTLSAITSLFTISFLWI